MFLTNKVNVSAHHRPSSTKSTQQRFTYNAPGGGSSTLMMKEYERGGYGGVGDDEEEGRKEEDKVRENY